MIEYIIKSKKKLIYKLIPYFFEEFPINIVEFETNFDLSFRLSFLTTQKCMWHFQAKFLSITVIYLFLYAHMFIDFPEFWRI